MTGYSSPLAAGSARRRFGPGVERILSFLTLLYDVFAETQQKARAAHQRYPFADW